MFSPSLVSMMYHSLDSDPQWGEGDLVFKDVDEAARIMMSMVTRIGSHTDWAQVPVTAWSDNAGAVAQHLSGDVGIDIPRGDAEGAQADRQFLWGRVPVNSLVALLANQTGDRSRPPDREFLDLGGPVDVFASSPATLSPQQVCDKYLASRTISPDVTLGIIDLQDASASPQDANWFRHPTSDDLLMSQHALGVMAVLVERLAHNGILNRSELAVAMAKPPAAKQIGRTCFQHLNAVDVQSAMARMKQLTDKHKHPVVVSTSLGIHLGPHNGQSPLEDYTRRLVRFDKTRPRHVVAAAGNFGLNSVSAWGGVIDGVPYPISVQVVGGVHHELLIEFWWDESFAYTPSFRLSVNDEDGRPLVSDVAVDPHLTGAVLKRHSGKINDTVCSSMFRSKCYGTMGCAAVALSVKQGKTLPALEVIVETSVSSAPHPRPDAPVQAWICVGHGRNAVFVSGAARASIAVPASTPEVISVAGVDQHGALWRGSSIGPATIYHPWPPHVYAPKMAHLKDGGVIRGEGTSMSAPRAAADIAGFLLGPGKGWTGNSADDLVKGLLIQHKRLAAGGWSRGIGFGAIAH